MNKRDWVTSLASLVVLGLVAFGLSGCAKSPKEQLAEADKTFLADVIASGFTWTDNPSDQTKIKYGHVVCYGQHRGLDNYDLSKGMADGLNGPLALSIEADKFVTLAEKDLCPHMADWSEFSQN